MPITLAPTKLRLEDCEGKAMLDYGVKLHMEKKLVLHDLGYNVV